MADTRQMNGTATNVGGFTGSAMYNWLTNMLFNQLPSDLRTVIKTVNKKTSAGNQSATINTNSMKIFLFSEVECFGTATNSALGEGTKYPIFTDNNSRAKGKDYWLRSPRLDSSANFMRITGAGDPGSAPASNMNGFFFGLCV